MADPDPADPDARRRLAELQELFRPRLAERVREIQAAWEAVQGDIGGGGGSGGEPLRLLHRLAHSLAGAAGTFGYPEIGTAARALERRLQGLETPAIPAITEIASLLAALARAAAAAAA